MTVEDVLKLLDESDYSVEGRKDKYCQETESDQESSDSEDNPGEQEEVI